MKRIVLEVSDEQHALLTELVAGLQIDEASHGKLTVKGLAAMLLEDAAMVVSRPGSWEGSKMADLLTSHGYL